MTELTDLVRHWPGRFARAGVLAALHGVEPPGTGALVDAALDDVIAGRDEEEAIGHLLATGEFAAVRAVLDDDRGLTPRRRATLREQLDQRTAGRLRQAVEWIRRLEQEAYRAGLPLDTERELIEYACGESWPGAERLLRDMEGTLHTAITAATERLRGRLGPLAPAVQLSVGLMLREGYLREVEQRLERGDLEIPGPVAVPVPRPWTWQQTPAEVLDWFLDPRPLRPPAFVEWQEAAAGPEAEQLLSSLRALESGGRDAAVAFADALTALLQPAAAAQPADAVRAPEGGGYLVPLGNVFLDPEIAPFRPDATVRLLVADPDVDDVPGWVGELPGFTVAVGWGLNRRGTTERHPCAVLETRDLLRLVAGPPRRSVTLVRLLARQWPLEAIGASPARLPRLLDAAASEWTALTWLVDLAGLGGLSRAAELTFETGCAPRVLAIFLDLLAAPGGSAARTGRPLERWSDNDLLRAQVEAAVLHEVRTTEAGRAAFWAALRSAPPGEVVTLDDLVRTVTLETDEDREWATELEAGMAAMTALPYVQAVPGGGLRLQEVGVLLDLRGFARPRLRAAVAQLSTRTPEPQPAMTAWTANRYALTEDWLEYERVLAERTDEPAVLEVRARLVRPPERLVELAREAPVAGRADLAVLLDELREEFRHAYPSIRLTVDAPPPAAVSVDPRVVRVILHELITNGADAVGATGRVEVTVRDEDEEFLVEIRDSGAGLPTEIRRPERAFRQGFSTHGPGRGDGLYIAAQLVQRADGNLVFDRRAGDDPLFPGACLQLVLPAVHPQSSFDM